MRAKRERGRIAQPHASPRRTAISRARALKTGRQPGRPSTTGSVSEFGRSPKEAAEAEKALEAVASWTCTSRPITGSHFM
ncbi:MAG TPA: hypothetical protein VMZ28_13820 [Kofleriaceae bacterium]|nr:hypothetical protein [Kofleriaceae bacterium]